MGFVKLGVRWGERDINLEFDWLFNCIIGKSQSIVEEEVELQTSKGKLLKRLMDLSKPEIHWIIIGCLASIVFGAGTPFFAILFGDMLKLFTYEASEAMKQARIYALAFGGVGFAFLLSMAIQGWMFSISGQRLTERVRIYMFNHMLKQEMGWFDQDKNNTGALCARLSNNAEAISGATGAKGQIILEGFSFVSSNLPRSKRNFLKGFCTSL